MENQSISLNPFMIIYKRIIYNNNLEEEKTFIHQKFIEINDFLLSKANSSYLTHEDFNLIRKFAISEGGFIENKFRKILWKKIFNISDIRHNSNHSYNKIKLIKLQFLNEMEYKYEEVIHDKVDDLNSYKNNLDILHLDLIKRDVERSAVHIIKDLHKINSFFNFKKLKSDLVDFIVKIFSLEKFKYDYYQGYHDLVLFIFLIFQDSQDNFLLPILIAQRINEIFLSDYLNKEKNFVEIIQNNLISVLKITDIEVYNEILNEDPSESFSSFCLSWIICLFAQKFENSEKIYQILDFIFCSDSSAVYHLAANLICLEWNKFKKFNVIENVNNYEQTSFIEHLSKIDFNNLDVQNLILQAEKSLIKHIKIKNSHGENIQVTFNGTKLKFENIKIGNIGNVFILHEISKLKNENQFNRDNRGNRFKIVKYLLLQSLSFLLCYLFIKIFYFYK